MYDLYKKILNKHKKEMPKKELNIFKEDKPTLKTLSIEKGVSKEVVGSYENDEIKAQIKVLDVYWTTKVEPPRPTQSYYTYYEAEQDQAFQVVKMEVKNTGTESFSDYVFEGFLSDTCTPTFTYDGGYKYTGINLVELERDSSNKYDLGSFYSLSPLATKTIYAIKKVPKEVTSKTLEANLCFGDNVLEINW